MSVIQQIQEKYAKLMAIIIAVALMIFVVMLAFENGGRLFGGNSTTVGKVNGTTIEYNDFLKKVDLAQKGIEQQYRQFGGTPSGLQEMAVNQAWNQEVDDILQENEEDKLGITVGKKEMGDILYGQNAIDELKKSFTDSTGFYNGQAAKARIDQILRLKKGTPQEMEMKDQVVTLINFYEKKRLSDKFNSLLNNSVNYPKWFVEKQIAENSEIAKLSLVRANYSDNNDTTIKISDKEIEDYVSKHKKEYPQQENRAIDYIAFSASPSKADTAAARERVLALKPQFDSIKSVQVQQFLAAQGVNTFFDNYVRGSMIQIPVKDSIFKLPINGVYGPYLDGGSYTLAKLLGVRQEPEMVKVRHILISTATRDPQNPQQMIPTRDTAVARKLVDSIQTAIRNGSRFDSLAVKFSDDSPLTEGKSPGKSNKEKYGVYDSVRSGAMVAEFNDFTFGNPVGTKGVVKTEYGYHYIEILGHIGALSPAYKIAYLPRPIEASPETEMSANNDAAKFAGDSRDQKSFNANAEKLLKERGINKGVAQDIQPSAYYIGSLGQSRSFVRKIYDASLGDVLEPERVGDNWVVALVTEINQKGTMSASRARLSGVETILRNKKIADKLVKKIGNVTTLEAVSTTLGNKPIETIDSLRIRPPQTNRAAQGLVGEPRVIGAAFNPANKDKVIVIEGINALFVIKPENISATSVASANVAEERKMRNLQGLNSKKTSSQVLILRDAADIKDKRSKFF